jgi:hypothetical protein
VSEQPAAAAGDFPYFFVWRNNPKREEWYGRRVRIVAQGAKRTVLIEAASGERMFTSLLALRRIRRRKP